MKFLLCWALVTCFGSSTALETLPGPRFATARASAAVNVGVGAKSRGEGCPWPGCGVADPTKPIDKGWQAVAVLQNPGGAAGGGVPEGGYSGGPEGAASSGF